MRVRAVFVVSACAACSLIVPLDDLGTRDASPSDGGGNDAPFCKQANHTLCDDFDELALGALWTSQHVTSAMLSLDDAAAVSPPHSLLASVADASAGVAYLQKDFSGSASRVTCAFDARVDALSTVPVLSFSLDLASTDPSRPDYNITLLHTSAKTSYSEWTGLSDGGGSSNGADLPALPVSASKWTHVVVDMSFGAGSISITYDGASVLATGLAAPPNSAQTLLLGVIEYIATPVTMHFDDVACDIVP